MRLYHITALGYPVYLRIRQSAFAVGGATVIRPRLSKWTIVCWNRELVRSKHPVKYHRPRRDHVCWTARVVAGCCQQCYAESNDAPKVRPSIGDEAGARQQGSCGETERDTPDQHGGTLLLFTCTGLISVSSLGDGCRWGSYGCHTPWT